MLYILCRSIQNPFQRAFTSKTIVSIVIIIYVLALLMNFAEFYYMKYLPYPDHPDTWWCYWNVSRTLASALSIKKVVFVSIIPFPILITVHIKSYNQTMKSANNFKLNTQKIRTLKNVRKTFFMIITLFFLLTIPSSIFVIIVECIIMIKPNILPDRHQMYNIARFCVGLVSLNSAVNPFVYAKIHRRFLTCLRRIRRGILQRNKRRVDQQFYTIELKKFQSHSGTLPI